MLEKAPARSATATPGTGKARATKDTLKTVARKSAGPRNAATRTAVRKTGTGAAPAGDLQAQIQQRAYELWERDGRPEGRDYAHWAQAEREITGTQRAA